MIQEIFGFGEYSIEKSMDYWSQVVDNIQTHLIPYKYFAEIPEKERE